MAPKQQKMGKVDAVKAAGKTAKALKEGTQIRKKKIRTSTKFTLPATKKITQPYKYPRKLFSDIEGAQFKKLTRYDHFKVIKYPVTTETAMKKIEEINTLVFIVDLKATKKHIKNAVKSIYSVDARKICTLILPDGRKKAYVRLSPDYDSLDVANKIGCI
eukprot:Selendium_serpulae@DN3735_c0_g1_i2.p1